MNDEDSNQSKPRPDTPTPPITLPAGALPASALPMREAPTAYLSHYPEASIPFLQMLRAFYETERELCCIEAHDDACRRAIELGRNRLGFDRLGLWFVTEDGSALQGSFGTDAQGAICDERSAYLRGEELACVYRLQSTDQPLILMEQEPLHDADRHTLGRGQVAVVGLWDGSQLFGALFCDNLLSQVPLTPVQQEMLILYSNSLGQLCARKRAEKSLRASERRLWQILETIQLAALTLNCEGCITFANDHLLGMTGCTYKEVVGEDWFANFVPNEEKQSVREYFLDLLAQKAVPLHHENHILARNDDHRLIAWNNTILKNLEGQVTGIASIGVDMTERRRQGAALSKMVHELKQSVDGTVTAMARAVEIRDPYTAGHQRRVSALACAIAHHMDRPEAEIEVLRVAGLLHDIGKLAIPAEILGKPTRLNQAEVALVQAHTRVGFDILKDTALPSEVAQTALQHHERMNGTGYPQGLVGNAIPLHSQIMAVADVVEAISSHRPYRPSLGVPAALEEITRNRGILYSEDTVDACLRAFAEHEYDIELLLAAHMP